MEKDQIMYVYSKCVQGHVVNVQDIILSYSLQIWKFKKWNKDRFGNINNNFGDA